MKAGGVSVMRADLDAATSTSTDAHEAQWRAGVNRQAQPEALSHQQAASQAAAAKRKASAMSPEERKAKRTADQKRRRAAAAATAETAAAEAAAEAAAVEAAAAEAAAAEVAAAEAVTAEAAAAESVAEVDSKDGDEDEHDDRPDIDELNEMLEADGQDPIDDDEYVAFSEWCLCHGFEMHEESYCDWMGDHDGGERFHAEREMDDYASDEEDSEPAKQVRAQLSSLCSPCGAPHCCSLAVCRRTAYRTPNSSAASMRTR